MTEPTAPTRAQRTSDLIDTLVLTCAAVASDPHNQKDTYAPFRAAETELLVHIDAELDAMRQRAESAERDLREGTTTHDCATCAFFRISSEVPTVPPGTFGICDAPDFVRRVRVWGGGPSPILCVRKDFGCQSWHGREEDTDAA